ncbi:MAG: DUF86 domain-containing protein [Candidatus Lokiarchaeota archaeon]|nr:DUF86 domain-containing protein [Candidatus Lokiarchaeota archaeon]MCK4479262.1 DUF86 domain-containing protein [Candidatus Lokiarchaeota archaeon]
MKINRDLVITRLNKLNELLDILNELKNTKKEDFLSNYKNYFTAQRTLEICINICIDIGNHIVSLNNIERPETFSDIIKILAKHNVISEELSTRLIKMVRFRNLLGHFYLEIDNEIIYNILQNDIKDFNSFREAILAKL